MEQPAKLAAVFLGIYFIFTAFPRVSSTRVYNPELIIKQITKLLTHLEKDLERLANHSEHFRVEGPTKNAWENDINCTGSFLDIFTNGTEAISGKFSDNSVTHISRRISNCVEHLEDTDCTKLKRYHNESCEKEINGQKVIYFVDQFLGFSKAFPVSEICGPSSKQEYDRRQDDWPELDDIC